MHNRVKWIIVGITVVTLGITGMVCNTNGNKEQTNSTDIQEQTTLESTPTPAPLIEQAKTAHQQNGNAGIYDFIVYQDVDIHSVQPDAYREHVEKEGWPNNYKSSGNYDQSVFDKNRYQVKVDKTIRNEDEIVKAISVDFAKQLVGKSRIREIKQSDFGYMCWLDWGSDQENNKGHVLIAFITLQEKTIWWSRCR